MVGLVTSATRCPDGTDVEIVTDAGRHVVCVEGAADHAGARDVERVVHRGLSLRVSHDGAGWQAVVRGVGHRRPVSLPVSSATALALIERGVPTVLRLP